jgi:hypothetical protein
MRATLLTIIVAAVSRGCKIAAGAAWFLRSRQSLARRL